MILKSNWIFFVIFAFYIAFILFPINWYTTSDTNIRKVILLKFINFLCLYKISNWLSINFIESPIKKPRPAKYLRSSWNHQIIAIFFKILTFNKSLHNRDSPTFMSIILFKDSDKILIPKEFSLGWFFILFNVL
jgi:hypothetical protein